MKTYLERLLVEGEEIHLHTRRHPLFAFLKPVLLHLALLAASAGIARLVTLRPELLPVEVPGVWLALLPLLSLPYTLSAYLIWRTREFAVTDLRVMKVEGILSKTHHDASLEKINDLTLRQSFLGRLLGWGDLTVFTGNDAHGVAYTGVRRPVLFKRAVTALKETGLRRPAGVPPEEAAYSQLERLGRLRDQGVLTEDEFQAKKAELMDRI